MKPTPEVQIGKRYRNACGKEGVAEYVSLGPCYRLCFDDGKHSATHLAADFLRLFTVVEGVSREANPDEPQSHFAQAREGSGWPN